MATGRLCDASVVWGAGEFKGWRHSTEELSANELEQEYLVKNVSATEESWKVSAVEYPREKPKVSIWDYPVRTGGVLLRLATNLHFALITSVMALGGEIEGQRSSLTVS